jgi:mono/diheme cytochrome c family protein
MQQRRKQTQHSHPALDSQRPSALTRSMSEFTIKCPKCAELLGLPGRPRKAITAKCTACGYEGKVSPDRVKNRRVVVEAQPVTTIAAPLMLVTDPATPKRRSGRGLLLVLAIGVLGVAGWQFRDQLMALMSSSPEIAARPEQEDLSAQAHAILKQHCAACHADGKSKGGFGIVIEGKELLDGYYVTPGNSATSELFARLSHTDADLKMPPADAAEEQPTLEDIEVIRRWIDSGASLVAFSAPTAGETRKTVPVSVTGTSQELAGKARNILKTTCYRCHGESGRVEGGFNFVMNRDKLVAGGMIVAGDVESGKLLRRLHNDSMPPRGQNPRPSQEDIGVLESWIKAGAPDFNDALNRTFITNAELFRRMEQNLLAQDEFDREFTRYFTLTHLFNADVSDEEMETYRLALAKILNSLSRQKELLTPHPIDAEKTILRIDLRQLKWDQSTWKHIISADPYAVRFNDAKTCSSLTGCGVPSVRGDWFVHKAAQPKLYHAILEIPETLDALLAEERIDIDRNIREAVAIRAGFNESGVSDNNRLIERHPSTHGAFWISYDFAGNKETQNLLSHPLGPGIQEHHFKHDGGEVIFSLPNGLQAYMLVDAKGQRLDQGPLILSKTLSRATLTC